MGTPTIRDAQAYGYKGKAVFPCGQDKKPLTSHGFKDATTDPEKIRVFWTRHNGANIGMTTGPASGFFVLDVDLPDGPATLANLEAEHGKLPVTLEQITGSGGRQLFFRYPKGQKVTNNAGKLGPGLDIRGDGGYVIVPPSLHASGRNYQWKDKHIQAAEAPEWLLDLICAKPEQARAERSVSLPKSTGASPYGQAALTEEAVKVASAPEGTRNHTLNQAAYAIGQLAAGGEVDPSEAEAVLTDAGLQAGLAPSEAHKTVASGMKAGEKQPRQATSSALACTQDTSLDEWEPIRATPWPVLSPDTMPGIVGEFVALATASSEADPAAVLATFLARFGCEVFGYAPGEGPYMMIGDARHYPRVFMAIVGASSKARKGTSAKPVDRLFQLAAENKAYAPARTSGGPLSSGEGIAFAVRDEMKEWQVNKRNMIGEYVVTDPGISDKRLFVLDEELAAALASMKREGNTLSMILRALWDDGNVSPLTKKNQVKTTGAHVVIVTHITGEELRMKLDTVDIFNGFANRFLWICAKRSKFVSRACAMPEHELGRVRKEMLRLVQVAQGRELMQMDRQALDVWDGIYPELAKDHPGLTGVVINRGEAQTQRLAMIYALLDGKGGIDPDHLKSALAFWDYARASALHIFGGRTADPLAEKVLKALEDGPKTLTDLNDHLKGHTPSGKLKETLTTLERNGQVFHTQEKTGGRSKNIFHLCGKSGKSGISPECQELFQLNPLFQQAGENNGTLFQLNPLFQHGSENISVQETDPDDIPDEVTI